MSPESTPTPLDLQFDKAEHTEAPSLPACHVCHQAIAGEYFAANGQPVCPSCSESISQQLAQPNPTLRELGHAALYGSGAALLGTLLYFAVLAITGYELGIMAIGVGWAVGRAVAKGGKRKGGWKLQALALALTYCSIAGSYMPLIMKESVELAKKDTTKKTGSSKGAATAATPSPAGQPAAPVGLGQALMGLLLALVVFAGLSLAIPFLTAFQNPIGLLIIGFGLFEAWKLNRRTPLLLEGPFQPAARVS